MKILKRGKDIFPETGKCSRCGREGEVWCFRVADDAEWIPICGDCMGKIENLTPPFDDYSDEPDQD